MFDATNTVDYDVAMQEQKRNWVQIIYILFVFIVNFFVINLFISVIVDKFKEEIMIF